MAWTMFDGSNFPDEGGLYLVTEAGAMRPFVDLVIYTEEVRSFTPRSSGKGFVMFTGGTTIPWSCVTEDVIAWMPCPKPAERSE